MFFKQSSEGVVIHAQHGGGFHPFPFVFATVRHLPAHGAEESPTDVHGFNEEYPSDDGNGVSRDVVYLLTNWRFSEHLNNVPGSLRICG